MTDAVRTQSARLTTGGGGPQVPSDRGVDEHG